MAMPETHAASVVEAELAVPSARVQIMRLDIDRPTNRMFHRATHYWIDMCLTPRPEHARGCYHAHWGPHRFDALGEIFLLPPGETLHIRTEAGSPQLSIVCEIERHAVERWLEQDMQWNDRRLAAGLDIAHPHIRACMFRLAQEVRAPGPGSHALVEMVTGQLAIEIARYCEAIAEGPVTGGLASWRLRLIEQRLETPGTPPSLEELAQLCSLSIRQLTRGFRASRGLSIGDHIAQTRIQMAKRLLGGGDSIKSIAFALGFASPSSLSYTFRRATGATPRQFRARQLRKR